MNYSDIRQTALNELKGNWKQPVLAALLFALITILTQLPFVGILFSLFILMPIEVSYTQAFLKFRRGEKDRVTTNMFDCFQNYGKNFLLGFLVAIFIILWTLLFIIPGFIKSLSYSMSYYISLDHPEFDANKCIEESMKMMKGHKWELFVLSLTFIGWILLGILTIFIGFLWIGPYIETSIAEFYERIKGNELITE